MTMRYFTFTLVPLEDGGFHPALQEAIDHPALDIEQLVYINLLEDKTGVTLLGGRGTEAASREVLVDNPHVIDWELLPGNDDALFAYIHFEAREPAVGLLELIDDYRLILDLPIKITPEGDMRVTVIGTDENIQDGVQDIPDTIDAEATEMGVFNPDDERALARLTTRQREVLEAAVELGYYEVPRQATYEEIAEVCDCTVGTVGEHLNRIESRIIHAALE